jgi:UDP-N-acetylmuramoyl-L-alanyl-D-glutamate--2,6-diaminopimelate ligase
MKLSKLLDRIIFEKPFFHDIDISSISIDSRKISKDSLFIAWKGINFDSHLFIDHAIQNGAIAIIAEKKVNIPDSVPVILVKNARKAYSIVAQNFFSNPADQLKLIGITGTTGKTTIAYIIYRLLNNLEVKTGLIGTSGYYSGNLKLDTLLKGPVTTPEPMELNKLFYIMQKDGCLVVVMEASSFGLDQKRIFGLSFHQAILSNLSYNHHVNYHQDMKGYILSKEELFKQLSKDGLGIINSDSEYIDSFHVSGPLVKTIGLGNADYKIQDFYQTEEAGITFSLQIDDIIYEVSSPLSGFYQTYNISQAFASLHQYGFEIKDIIRAISQIETIPGRWHFIKSTLPFSILIDKANTPIAIKSVIPLLEKKKYTKKILVFGNVGGGDSVERRMMANLFYKTFEEIIVTSDDPEDEDPMETVIDFLKGIPDYDNKRIIIELDRKKAIRIALEKAKQNNLVAIFGRGNQREFIQKGIVSEFDDIAETNLLVKELEKKSESSF